MELKILPQDWDYVSAAIHQLTMDTTSEYGFFGLVLQSMKIDLSFDVPTAGVMYDKKRKQIRMTVNPFFFRHLSIECRAAVLLHEIFHVINGHLARCPLMGNQERANVAADVAINQFIPDITKGDFSPVLIEDYDLPPNMTMEWYYEKLPEDLSKGKGEGKGKGPGKPHDTHDWQDCEESDALEATEDLIKRTMTKTSLEYSMLPKSAKDILDYIEKRQKTINWRRELKTFLKRTTTGIDKEPTRRRPNKRYGYLSPGLKLGELPKLLVLIDTSGSISTEELTMFLNEIDALTKVGARKINIGLWHTSLYYHGTYRRNHRSDVTDKLQSGGTDFECCIKYIEQMKPDGVVVLTDLCFGDTVRKVLAPVLFVASHDGAEKSPTTYPKQRVVRMSKDG